MSGPHLIVEVRDGVMYVLINRADKRNALSRPLLQELRETFQENAWNDGLLAAVITGAGDRCFAAGGDLRDLDGLRSAAEGRAMAAGARDALDAIRSFPVPVVAALNGDALGGGAELSASCDFRVAAGHARIGFIQGRLSISTAWGGGVDLFRIVGRQKALRLLTTATMLSAEEALDCGLVDAVAAADQSLEDAVEDFLRPARAISPHVHRAFKSLAAAAPGRDEAEAVELENFAQCWAHEDHWKAHDAFLKKAAG